MLVKTDRSRRAIRHRVDRPRRGIRAAAVLLAVATATATGVVSASPARALETVWMPMGVFSGYHDKALLAATSRTSGETDLFAVSSSNLVYHRWRLTGGWSPFGSLGKPSTSPIKSITAAARPSGQLYVFVSTQDGKVWQRTWTESSGWRPWAPVKQNSWDWVMSVSAAVRHDGTLDLVGLGTDGNVYHRWQAREGSDFSPWGTLGKPAGGIWLTPAVASGKGVDIIVSSDVTNGFYQRSWRSGSGWDRWVYRGAPNAGITDEVAATAKRSGGDFDVFAVHNDRLYRRSWKGGSFGSWYNLGDPTSGGTGSPTVTYDDAGTLDIFVMDDNSGAVYWKQFR